MRRVASAIATTLRFVRGPRQPALGCLSNDEIDELLDRAGR